MLNSTDFKNFEMGHQYILHSHDMYFLEKNNYDTLPLRVINHAFRLAVDEILTKYHVKVLSDIPFGRGYCEMRERFAQLLKESKEIVERR